MNIQPLIDQSRVKLDPLHFPDGTFLSFVIAVPADAFLPYATSPRTLIRATKQYARAMADLIDEKCAQTPESSERQMDYKHIKNETLAHVIPWFLYVRKHGHGSIYEHLEELNLNLDESHPSVRFLMVLFSIL